MPTKRKRRASNPILKKFMFHVSQVLKDANVITSHVLYKIKTLDDGSMIFKARTAPHGNKDKKKDSLKTDSQKCPALGFRIFFSFCTIFKWFLAKIDIQSAFL